MLSESLETKFEKKIELVEEKKFKNFLTSKERIRRKQRSNAVKNKQSKRELTCHKGKRKREREREREREKERKREPI